MTTYLKILRDSAERIAYQRAVAELGPQVSRSALATAIVDSEE